MWVIGRALVRPPRRPVAALAAGWGIGTAVGLVPVLNVVWWTLGGVFGVGAIIVAIWGARRAAPERPSWFEGTAGQGRHRSGRVPPVPEVPASATAMGAPSAAPPETPLAED